MSGEREIGCLRAIHRDQACVMRAFIIHDNVDENRIVLYFPLPPSDHEISSCSVEDGSLAIMLEPVDIS